MKQEVTTLQRYFSLLSQDDIRNLCKKIITEIIQEYKNEQDLNADITSIREAVKRLELDIENKKERKYFLLGQLQGVIDVISSLNNNTMTFEEINLVKEHTECFEDILNILSEREMINHKELAEILHITEKYLQEIIEIILEIGLIYKQDIGNERYYYMSVLGEEYMRNEDKIR